MSKDRNIALLISPLWMAYYAHSPYRNLLKAEHPRFQKFSVYADDLKKPEIQEQINKCVGIVMDSELGYHTGFYTNGPKLLIAGDIHAHTKQDVYFREKDFAVSTYVMSGGLFCEEHPNYKYFNKDLRKKMIYLPNSIPDDLGDVTIKWDEKENRSCITGSISDVYPFRRDIVNSKDPTVSHYHGRIEHKSYFKTISKYKVGFSCPSILGYTIAKYFEIPAVGSYLIAPPINPVEKELLHSKEFFHEFKGDARAAISLSKKLIGMNRESLVLSPEVGFDPASASLFVQLNHTAARRLEYMTKIIDRCREGSFLPDEAHQIFKDMTLGKAA